MAAGPPAWAALAASALLFLLAFRGAGVAESARATLGVLSGAAAALRAPGLDDRARERAARAAALRALGCGAGLLGRGAIPLAAASLPVVAAHAAGLAPASATLALMESWPGLMGGAALILAAQFALARAWPR